MVKRHRTLATGGAAGLILLAVFLLAVFGPATPAQAQIDISGDWNFDVFGFGPEAIPCPSTIEQTDATFTIDVECTNIGLGSFAGEIDVETGEFTASGDIAGIPIELAGTASQDGETIEGTWDSSIGLSGTISAERKPPGLTPTPKPTLPAPAEMTGTWRISFIGVFGGSCDVVIEQNGEELSTIASCSILGILTLDGTIDTITGGFNLSGSGISIEGHVLSDGDSFTGTWDAFSFLTGSLTGERVDIELVDISGDWDAVLLGEVSDTCLLEIEQDLLVASAVLDCEGLSERSLEGSVNPFSGFLSLRGTLGDVEIALSGQLSADGSYIFGREFAGPVFLSGATSTSRTFIAVPAGALERGIVLLNCRPEAELVANNCSYGAGVGEMNEFPIEVQVAVAPVGGYAGLEATLSWAEALMFGEATPSSQCVNAAGVNNELSLSLTCSFAERSDFVGSVFSLTMTCVPGSSAIDLGDTSFQDLDENLGPPTLINATVTCFGPQRGGPGPPLGDADCSFEVTSIDAALVLQFDAGLLESLDCQSAADVNRDGNVNSIDATLILQDVAGLL
ncbi:MAG: dockerin type I repeat-containing protein [Chloroflexi bacterium]|nr:dockerin type I repeat-containing protein [Chloroflexota bacterium]